LHLTEHHHHRIHSEVLIIQLIYLIIQKNSQVLHQFIPYFMAINNLQVLDYFDLDFYYYSIQTKF